ncbi:MAG: hypothetical protein FJZ56_00035 [Chlamydiae bacterium]|nr:hypothetical protein [Chlamydiota bacterium]
MCAITASYSFFTENHQKNDIAFTLQRSGQNDTQLIQRAQNDQNFCKNLISYLLKNGSSRNDAPSDREILVKILISLTALDPTYEETLDTFIENQLILTKDFENLLLEDVENREKIRDLLASKQPRITRQHKRWHEQIAERIGNISDRLIAFSQGLQVSNFTSKTSLPQSYPISKNLAYYPSKITSPYPEENTETTCYLFTDLEDNRHRIELLETCLESISSKDESKEDLKSLNSDSSDTFHSLLDEEENTISSYSHNSSPRSITTINVTSFESLNNWLMICENDSNIIAKIAAWAFIVFSAGIGYAFLLFYTYCFESNKELSELELSQETIYSYRE